MLFYYFSNALHALCVHLLQQKAPKTIEMIYESQLCMNANKMISKNMKTTWYQSFSFRKITNMCGYQQRSMGAIHAHPKDIRASHSVTVSLSVPTLVHEMFLLFPPPPITRAPSLLS